MNHEHSSTRNIKLPGLFSKTILQLPRVQKFLEGEMLFSSVEWVFFVNTNSVNLSFSVQLKLWEFILKLAKKLLLDKSQCYEAWIMASFGQYRSRDLRGLLLVNTGQVTRLLVSDWSIQVTWLNCWSLIGHTWSVCFLLWSYLLWSCQTQSLDFSWYLYSMASTWG